MTSSQIFAYQLPLVALGNLSSLGSFLTKVLGLLAMLSLMASMVFSVVIVSFLPVLGHLENPPMALYSLLKEYTVCTWMSNC